MKDLAQLALTFILLRDTGQEQNPNLELILLL